MEDFCCQYPPSSFEFENNGKFQNRFRRLVTFPVFTSYDKIRFTFTGDTNRFLLFVSGEMVRTNQNLTK